jgi:hypothetical protein
MAEESRILNYIKDIVFELDGAIYGESIYRYYMQILGNISADINNMTIIIKFQEYKYMEYFKNVISIFCTIHPYISSDYINMDTFKIVADITSYNIILVSNNTTLHNLPEFAININNIEMTRRGLMDNRANTNFYKSLDNIINRKFTYYIDDDTSESMRSHIYDRVYYLIKLGYECTTEYTAKFYKCDKNGCGECGTCSAEFVIGDIIVLSRCNHKFHWDCDSGIKYWLLTNNTCPYCRCNKFV